MSKMSANNIDWWACWLVSTRPLNLLRCKYHLARSRRRKPLPPEFSHRLIAPSSSNAQQADWSEESTWLLYLSKDKPTLRRFLPAICFRPPTRRPNTSWKSVRWLPPMNSLNWLKDKSARSNCFPLLLSAEFHPPNRQRIANDSGSAHCCLTNLSRNWSKYKFRRHRFLRVRLPLSIYFRLPKRRWQPNTGRERSLASRWPRN